MITDSYREHFKIYTLMHIKLVVLCWRLERWSIRATARKKQTFGDFENKVLYL